MIKLIHGTMKSGKTARLIEEYKNFNGKKVAVLPQKFFDAGRREIISRNGEKIKNVVSLENVAEKFGVSAIFVDEAEFLSKKELGILLDLSSVICCVVASLETDFLGNKFSMFEKLFGLSDVKQKETCKCEMCGKNDAKFNVRVSKCGEILKSGDEFVLDGEAKYLAVCDECN